MSLCLCYFDIRRYERVVLFVYRVIPSSFCDITHYQYSAAPFTFSSVEIAALL